MSNTPSTPQGASSLSENLDNALGIEHLDDAPTAFLVGFSGVHAGRLFKVKPGTSTIGRTSKAFVSLSEKAVSHRHAQLTLDASGCTIEDLESTNGTFVNDVRLTEPRVLVAGDVLRIGNSALGYLTDAEDEQQHTRAMARITAPRLTGQVPSPAASSHKDMIAIVPVSGDAELVQAGHPLPLSEEQEKSGLDDALDKLELLLGFVRRYWLLLCLSSLLLGLGGILMALVRPPPAVAEFLIYLRQERAPDPDHPVRDSGMHGGEFFAFAERNFTNADLVRKSLQDMDLPTNTRKVDETARGLAFAQVDREGTFQGTFHHPNPDFAEQFLAQHLQNFLGEEIGKSLTVLTSEVGLLEKQFQENEKTLADVEMKLRDFKSEHLDALPENAPIELQSKATLQAQRDRLTADLERAQAELALTKKRLASEDALVGTKVARSEPYEQALTEVRQKLAAARAQGFAEGHPEISKLKAEESRLEELKRSAIEKKTTDVDRLANSEFKRLKDRAGELGVLISSTSSELAQVQSRLGEVARIARAMPGVEADIGTLLRKAESAKAVHSRLHADLKKKELELQFERASVAARYQVIEAPSATVVPKSKAILKLGGIGFAAGIFLGAFLAIIHWLITYARTRKLPKNAAI